MLKSHLAIRKKLTNMGHINKKNLLSLHTGNLTCAVMLEMNMQVRPSATSVFIMEPTGHVGAAPKSQ